MGGYADVDIMRHTATAALVLLVRACCLPNVIHSEQTARTALRHSVGSGIRVFVTECDPDDPQRVISTSHGDYAEQFVRRMGWKRTLVCGYGDVGNVRTFALC